MATGPIYMDGRAGPGNRRQTLSIRSAYAAATRPHREPESAVAIKQRGCIAGARAFDREQPKFCGDPAVGGEAARLAAGREHAVAWNDDRKWIAPQRLTHLPRQAGSAEPCRDLAVGERHARHDRACDLVNAAVEYRQAIHVERDRGEIARLPPQERDDGFDRVPHVGWRRCLARPRASPDEPRARSRHVPLGKLQGDEPMI